MDPISTALTAAWLDAVRRVQSERVQDLERLLPQGSEVATLTDAIEAALKSGGAAPLNVSETGEQGLAGERPPVHLVDLLV